jgi:hypothetical protein
MTEQKIEQFWRDATAGDTTSGKHLAARFRDYPNGNWADNRTLAGWRRIAGEPSLIFYDEAGVAWFQCQVYEPQQWWLNRPDPGEGYRLLEKFPDEELKKGDEWLRYGEWKETERPYSGQTKQTYGAWYRRRIEPVKQDAGSTSASNIPKGWTALSDDEPRLASDAYWSQDAEAWIIVDGWVEAANREKWPAIRQVENWRCMQLMEGCFYRLPNGHGIEVTKEGFELG